MDVYFYSPGRAECLGVVYVNSVRYHVHRMTGSRRSAYVMVRVTSGASVHQSEWIVPGTLCVEG